MGIATYPPAVLGGLTLLNFGDTALAAGGLVISGIDQSYQDLYIVVRDYELAASTAGRLYLQCNSDTTAGAHKQMITGGIFTGLTTSAVAYLGTYFRSSIEAVGYNPNANISIFKLRDYANTVTRKVVEIDHDYYGTSGNHNLEFGQGSYDTSGSGTHIAITSVKLALDAGTFSHGDMYIYGVK